MSLLNNPIPPKPARFTPDGAPPGVAVDLTAFRSSSGGDWYKDRPIITPRLSIVHTNGARGEGSLQSQINWANANPSSNTHPHYSVNAPQPTKFVPTNRRAIGNATNDDVQGSHGDVSFFSIVIETADAGWPVPGDAGGFLYDHAEIVARILAYESILWGIPLEYPSTWYGAGTACHTEPFGYPYWTLYKGKACPGMEKKRQVREVILPRARQILLAWGAPNPQPPEEEDMKAIEPIRVYDTRNTQRPDGTWIPGGSEGKLKANEVRKVPVVFGSEAHINITVTATEGRGFVSVSSDGKFSGGASVVNFTGEPGEVCHNSVPVLAPGGHVFIKSSKGCHLIVDTFAQG